jgi:hypothetical protein
MSDGRDWQQPQAPQQGHGQPWRPERYDPRARRPGPPQQPRLPQDHQRQQPGYGQPQYGQPQYPPPPQYGQQPGWGPPPQQVPPGRRGRKSWPARHKVLAGLAAFGALAVIGSIANAAGTPKTTAATTADASSPAPASPHAGRHARAHVTAAPAAEPSAAPAPGPATVAAYAGSGIQNTPQFTVTSTWKLDYTYDCADDGGSGNFIVDEDGGSDFTGASVNELGAGGSSSTWVYGDAGTHYLAVNSECSWTVKIIDEGSS